MAKYIFTLPQLRGSHSSYLRPTGGGDERVAWSWSNDTMSVADNRAERQAEPIHGAKNETSFVESFEKFSVLRESVFVVTGYFESRTLSG
jgi:hypothetical protein